jgi:hypothetical protein
MIHKKISINLTARYFTDITIANQNNYFTALVGLITLTPFALQLNWTGDLW